VDRQQGIGTDIENVVGNNNKTLMAAFSIASVGPGTEEHDGNWYNGISRSCQHIQHSNMMGQNAFPECEVKCHCHQGEKWNEEHALGASVSLGGGLTPVEVPSGARLVQNLNSVVIQNSTVTAVSSASATTRDCVECKTNSIQDAAQNRSPKRQNPSVYERVKSKVSRSLSNGSVVQKLWVDTSPKSFASGNVFRRPTSLVVDNVSDEKVNNGSSNSSSGSTHGCKINDNAGRTSDIHKYQYLSSQKLASGAICSWACPRCTLENAGIRDRCEVCETPKKPNLPLGSALRSGTLPNTLPRNGIVITVPDWEESTPAEPVIAKPAVLRDLSTLKPPQSILQNSDDADDPTSPGDAAWQRPIYRRSFSEMNAVSNDGDHAKVSSNRRSMIETDAQGNIPVRSPVNLNLQLQQSQSSNRSATRYSYIGITDPSTQHQIRTSLSLNQKSVSTKQRLAPPPALDVMDLNDSNNGNINSSSPVTNHSTHLSSSSTNASSETSNSTFDRMWTCTK
jgi:hypothetical protein